MKTDIKYNALSRELMEQLPKGAFLTVKAGDKLNTMTIGWGSLAFMWQKPIFLVMVRYSRYTYQLLENVTDFTISIPLNKDLKDALAFCGTKSGRDIDKFKECNLTAETGKIVHTPIIGECDLHYECKIVYKQAMEPALLSNDIRKRMYTVPDYHVAYYGEIVACYKKE